MKQRHVQIHSPPYCSHLKQTTAQPYTQGCVWAQMEEFQLNLKSSWMPNCIHINRMLNTNVGKSKILKHFAEKSRGKHLYLTYKPIEPWPKQSEEWVTEYRFFIVFSEWTTSVFQNWYWIKTSNYHTHHCSCFLSSSTMCFSVLCCHATCHELALI